MDLRFKKFMFRVGGVSHNFSCTPQSPGGGLHILCRSKDALQSVLVLSRGGSVPDGDGGGEDRLSGGAPSLLKSTCFRAFAVAPDCSHGTRSPSELSQVRVVSSPDFRSLTGL